MRRLALILCAAAAPLQQAAASAPFEGEVVRTAPVVHSGVNPMGRDIQLSGPARDGDFVLGEISYVLTTDGRILVESGELLRILRPVLDPVVLARLDEAFGGATIDTEALTAHGITAGYDPSTFGVNFSIPVDMRPRQVLSLGGPVGASGGAFTAPAGFSAYLTAIGSADYIHKGQDTGFATPFVMMEGAARMGQFVLEGEATAGEDFRREGTRLVFDDLKRTARWTMGDLEPVARGFSGATPMAGLSVVRVYSDLEPQRNIQPRGERSFTLVRPSTVETWINGRPVQQIRLNPGTYDLRDFPFAQGSNDIQLIIRDDTGREEVVNFSIFFDRSLLAAGLTEFGVYAGTEATFGEDGREYEDRFTSSGFFRRGFTDELTLGANFQLAERGGVVGGEAVWASALGTLGGDLALSDIDGIGSGYAVNLSLDREFGAPTGRPSALSATLQVISERFANPNTLIPRNPFAYEIGLSYSRAMTDDQFFAADAFYSAGRGDEEDRLSTRATYGWRVTDRLFLNTEVSFEDRDGRDDAGVRVGLTYRFNSQSSGSAEYDSRRERARLGYQTSRGRGVGSWSGAGTIDYASSGSALNASLTTTRNRAELGLAHLTSFGPDNGDVVDQRTSVRGGASLAYADGQMAIGRPIFDSFALVAPHRSLEGRSVYIDPGEEDFSARSDLFGPAVVPDLAAYSPRAVVFDVPDAPAGYDLGDGVLRLMPAYRSGFGVEVGSDYSLTATGTLLYEDDQPIALVAGTARESAAPDREPVQLFTNRSGRFAVSGLRPGRWVITLSTREPRSFVIDIPDDTNGMVRLGPLKPEAPR